jgi:hypothetical protein
LYKKWQIKENSTWGAILEKVIDFLFPKDGIRYQK